ncbi:MAG: HIT family protein [Bdellovibrionaceae bacterium]|nr:HIT family protein [Pseudobdellovibrionaceae bacterium]MBX3032811.1 HIT family protein [Pseudobdellovibrionaceae bacterium]
MASVFTRIIQGELPCYKIHEDEETFSFLALDQVNPGHTLVIPKEEHNSWMDVPEDLYAKIHLQSQRIGRALMKATGCPRVGQIVAGFEVPHYHLHLIPAWSIPDLDFKRARRLNDGEMKKIQENILKHL